jgi:hypothetical protein
MGRAVATAPGARRGASLANLRAAHPGEWAIVERELTALVAARDRPALARWVTDTTQPLPAGSDPGERIRRRMAVAAVRGSWLAAAAGVRGDRIRFGLLNGFVAQRLLFAHGLERKPVSIGWFRLVWPLLWQRRRLLPLVQPKGIYCFYSRPLVDRLAALIGDRPCLEIAAGDGTLARFLRDRGVAVTATDDHSWKHAVTFPEGVIRQEAREALRVHSPSVVVCSWPPAGNTFERHVFRTRSVDLYVVIASKHTFAAGNWDDYRAQEAFTMEEDEALGALVLPPELESAVYVFRRRERR